MIGGYTSPVSKSRLVAAYYGRSRCRWSSSWAQSGWKWRSSWVHPVLPTRHRGQWRLSRTRHAPPTPPMFAHFPPLKPRSTARWTTPTAGQVDQPSRVRNSDPNRQMKAKHFRPESSALDRERQGRDLNDLLVTISRSFLRVEDLRSMSDITL